METNNIDSQIADLEKKLAELRKMKELELKKLTVHIHKFNPLTAKIWIDLSKFDSEIVNYLRYKTDRIWDSTTNSNLMSTRHLDSFLDFLKTLEYVTVTWEKKSLETYEEFKKAPDIFVDISKAYATLKLGPKMAGQYLTLAQEISSFSQDITTRLHKFSLAELFKFPTAIERQFGNKIEVKYSEEAQAELFKQLERRKNIAALANATDADVPNPFNDTGYDLKPHQRVAVKFAEVAGNGMIRTIIAYDMGTGKTFIANGIAELHKEYKRILIICPASLKTNWKREVFKSTKQEATVFQGIEPDELSIDMLVENKSRYYIINYDIIGRRFGVKKDGYGKIIDPGIMPWVELFNVVGFDLIIIDEAHYIKNLDSKRSEGVRSLKFKNVLPMTGTPVVNRPLELWPLLNIVDPDTFASVGQFAAQFTDNDGNPRNTAKLHEIMLPYMIRRTRKDVYGELHVQRIPFSKELSANARAHYQKILEGIYISLRKPDYVRNVTSILAELMRCKQVCSADNVETTADLATDAFEETGKKVIICSQFKESQYAIQNILGPQCVVVNGDVTDDYRYETMDKFQDKNSNIKFWVTNIVEGLTLTEAHTVIFNDLWWTPKDHSQLEGRAFGRDNDPHGGNAYYLQNESTIDEFINELLLKKMAIINELVDGIRADQESQGNIVSQLIEHLRGSI